MAKPGFVLLGQEQLKATLRDLPDKLFKRVMQAANTAAMIPVAQAYKAELRGIDLETGRSEDEALNGKSATVALSKGIKRRNKVYKKDGRIVTIIGPASNLAYKNDKGKSSGVPYLLIEFGGQSKDIGSIPALGPLRKTWAAHSAAVEQNYAASIEVGLEKIAKQEARKALKK